MLVTVGTDGFTNWVRLPDGQRMNLGRISVLSFLTKLNPNIKSVQRALDLFLSDGEALVKVDEQRMWALLAPTRTRWGSGGVGSFMPPDPRIARTPNMSTIDRDIAALETHINTLNRVAGKITPAKMQEGHAWLMRLAKAMRSDEAYFGIASSMPEAGLSFDVLQQNTVLAEDILAKSQETAEKIDRLASAGKKFNSAKAKADVYAVTSKVAGILREVDLTKEWVRGDLEKLASQADKLHGLFASAKV